MCNLYSITTNQAAIIALSSTATSMTSAAASQHENAMPPLSLDVADLAPSDPALTVYDKERAITDMRLLDADAEGADWREVARIALHIDPDHEPDRARQAFESHLARAQWMTKDGYYRHLLRRGWPR